MKSAKQLLALIAIGVFVTSTFGGERVHLRIDFTGPNVYPNGAIPGDDPFTGEGFLMLEGQDGWIAPIPFEGAELFGPGGIVNTHDPGLGGDPGFIELIGHEQTATRAGIPAVTGNATFMAWFHNNGNIPDDPPSGPDDFARRGNSGLQLSLGDTHSLNAGACCVDVDIETRSAVQGRALKYRKSNTGNIFQMFGWLVHGRVPPPPVPQEQFPPPDVWWGIRADLHWDPNAAGGEGRYSSWDFYYREDGDPDWDLIEADLRFGSQDSEGNLRIEQITAIHTWNRPCVGCDDRGYGPKRILMDDVWIGPTGGEPVYHSGFSRDEGFLMLAGQNDWVEPAGAHTATVNTFHTGVGEPDQVAGQFQLYQDPGYVELYGADDSSPSRPFSNTAGETRFEAWFNRVGTVPAVYNPDDENFDPDRPGHSGLQVALGNKSFDLEDAAVFITTRDTDHAIHYQSGPDGEMGIGPTPPDAGWWGVAADLHWDEDAGRFTSWDFSYQEQTDQKVDNWQLIAEGLGFRSQDGQGYDHALNGLMTWNRPCVECGDSDGFGPNRILMDRIIIEGEEMIEIRPGDIDGDGDVDFTDFSILAGNFTGTLDPGTGPKTRDNGDFDGDGDVDFGDFSSLAGNFTGTITAPAGDTPNTEGDVHLEIDLTRDGAMTLQANSANLAGYSIRSSDSKIAPDADNLATPFLFYLLNAPHEVTAGSVGSTTMLSADLALDISFAGDVDQAANVVFQYTRAGDVTPVDGVVHVIPEPTTMMLLAAGGLLVMPRRRRCA